MKKLKIFILLLSATMITCNSSMCIEANSLKTKEAFLHEEMNNNPEEIEQAKEELEQAEKEYNTIKTEYDNVNSELKTVSNVLQQKQDAFDDAKKNYDYYQGLIDHWSEVKKKLETLETQLEQCTDPLEKERLQQEYNELNDYWLRHGVNTLINAQAVIGIFKSTYLQALEDLENAKSDFKNKQDQLTEVSKKLEDAQIKFDLAKKRYDELVNNSGDESLIFNDIKGEDWFYGSVKYVYDNGLMTGLNETTFGPYENLARAQFAVILHRMNGSPDMEYTNKFPDVADNQWYTDAILWANEAGVVGGYTDTGKFGPGDNINREQMAVMMYRYANYLGYDTSARADISKYTDAGNVNEFAKEAMSWAVGTGIITGKENGTKLDPQGNASRAECATIIMRFMEYYK